MKWTKYFILIFSVLILGLINKYHFWFYASIDTFNDWYPNYGVILWWGKGIFLTLLICTLFLLIYWIALLLNGSINQDKQWIYKWGKDFLSYPFFYGIIIITFIIGEWYPFSFYPMYNNFPNWAYTFYFVDENNQRLTDYLKDGHGNISHIYFAEFNSRGWASGGENESKKHLNFVGKRIIEKSLDITQLKRDGVKKIKLRRINNHFVEDELKIDTTLIYSYDLNEN